MSSKRLQFSIVFRVMLITSKYTCKLKTIDNEIWVYLQLLTCKLYNGALGKKTGTLLPYLVTCDCNRIHDKLNLCYPLWHKHQIFRRDENNVDNDNARHFFRFKIIDFLTIMNVGYNITKTTRMSYLLRDSQGSYDFMQPYVWNHLCYSFRKPGFSKAVLVC